MTDLTPERRAELRERAERARPFVRHGGIDPAGVYIYAADLLALLDATDEIAGSWSDPTPAGEVCGCMCHEAGPALEHLDGGKCPCRTSGAINPNRLRRGGQQ